MKLSDTTRLREVCEAPISYFEKYGQVVRTQWGNYVYQDNDAKVLAVAHLDTAIRTEFFAVDVVNQMVVCSALDDRLGAWVLLDVLPALGLKFDLLLTEGEETGMSTAMHFQTERKYNWLFSFDRRGDDVVLYQYDDSKLRGRLTSEGFRIGAGTFSDIAELDSLGCKAFNVGVGYYDEHTKHCRAHLPTTYSQVSKFANFYSKHYNKRMKHDYTPITNRYGEWDDDVAWSGSANLSKLMSKYTRDTATTGKLVGTRVSPPVRDINGDLYYECSKCHLFCAAEEYNFRAGLCEGCYYGSKLEGL